jgi:protein-S-isoprenylcysteine O-methyltransferase Ste14
LPEQFHKASSAPTKETARRKKPERQGRSVRVDLNLWFRFSEAAWVVFLLYWFISAQKLKASKKRESSGGRLLQMAFMAAAYVLMFSDELNYGWLGTRFLPVSAGMGELGATITAVGVALAIWARWHLGENWSAMVTLKEGHELIRSGPYRRIRHPIYTGMLVAFAGTAMALGEYRGLIALGIALTNFYFKARKEERFLTQEFGKRFEEHAKHTGMFLPKQT